MSIKIKERDITDCGAACLASVAAHYKLKLPVARIRQMAGTDKKGTNLLGMIKAAEKMVFTAKGVKGGTDALPKIPVPAIAHVIVRDVLHHYIVVYKVSDNIVEFMDPGDGQMHKQSIEEFAKVWTGVLMLLAPGEDFSARNEKVSNFSRFIYLLKPHKSILTQALAGAIIYTLLGLSTSIYLQKITDHVLVGGNTNLLNLLSVAMVVLLLFQIFIGVSKTILMLRTGQKIDAQLILGYYKHLLKLPQRFFDTMRVGEIISRINDAVKIRAFINDTAVSLVVNVFIVVFSFGLMFIYSWKLALIMAIVMPLYIVIYAVTNKLNKKRERKLMEQAADLESQLVESLNSVKTIKQFGLEDFANIKTETRFISLLKTVYHSGLNSVFSSNSSEFLNRIFTIILLWVGSYFVISQSITPGELLSFYAILGYLTGPAAGLVEMNKTIQNALIASDRLFEIMDLERESDENKIELKKENLGDIRFQQVCFSYGTRVEVFKDFNLTIPKGKMTAIIGESGSGKTTLAGLLLKLYPLNGGAIYIGDHKIDYFTNKSMRTIISSVPQKLDLFAGNVIENIAVGDFEPDMEKILEISNQLGILEFIEKLPAGFNTYIGENGATLSGGQKQRLAIARALYISPEVIILDEATSSLDSESEHFVQKALANLLDNGKTIIVIAHRLSTIMNADKIAVLESGVLIEEGSHSELFHKKGKYYQMWQRQMPALSELIKSDF
ncbi:peptidase domain-containing ABC transporter [Alkalitalea saponilacus]|uniref:ATP-binding cassette, subfamily B n=1 Tax=Alkalitalea saponilacus TaxID=889453 RepID=A0A1T5HUA5_9BACT|nr:peptidase domain-containing ABC transporter [Alkalitalea saponilacus]ASB49309.1 peptide cleavage/export ABC transporter [Alkalitalea saponilacus]SKC24060.1 ATP-binding cassette, subfamily B [Alkalitalea saponilacus]